jgi:hypothetical protein
MGSSQTSPANWSAGFSRWAWSVRYTWFSLLVACEELLGDAHRGHAFGPAGVERDVGDGFDELLLGHAVLNGLAEVEAELFGVAAGGEHGHGDEAAVTGGKLGPVPDVLGEHIVPVSGSQGKKGAGTTQKRGASRKLTPREHTNSAAAQARRVITGVNEHGKSCFVSDEDTPFGSAVMRTRSAIYGVQECYR